MQCIRIAIGICLLAFMPAVASAEQTATVGEYEVNFDWLEKVDLHHNNLIVFQGNVRNGKACNQLLVEVLVRNPWKKELLVPLKAGIKGYEPQRWNAFKSEQQVAIEKRLNQRWIFEDIAVRCLQ